MNFCLLFEICSNWKLVHSPNLFKCEICSKFKKNFNSKFVQNSNFVHAQNLFKIRISFKLKICSKFEFCSNSKFVSKFEFCSKSKFVQNLIFCSNSKFRSKNFNSNFVQNLKLFKLWKEKQKICSYWAGPTGRSCGRSYPSSARKRSIGAPNNSSSLKTIHSGMGLMRWLFEGSDGRSWSFIWCTCTILGHANLLTTKNILCTCKTKRTFSAEHQV
jgi:hypothetical protein